MGTECVTQLLECCEESLRKDLTRAAVEDESLAVADALDKARFFVLGCENLIIAVPQWQPRPRNVILTRRHCINQYRTLLPFKNQTIKLTQ